MYLRANVLRSGVVVDNSDVLIGGDYVRGTSGGPPVGIPSGGITVLLEEDDTVVFQMAEYANTTNTYTIGGADSYVGIVEIPSEVRGVAGPAGGGSGLSAVSTDASVDGDGTAADPIGIADGGVTTAKLAALSVHTGKINDDAVTAAKLADDSVHHDAIVNNAVRPDNIQAGAVTETKIAAGSVTAAKMDSGTADDGHVPTADGSGGVAWEAQTGAGGMGGLDLYDSVPPSIGANGAVGTSGDAAREITLTVARGLYPTTFPKMSELPLLVLI